MPIPSKNIYTADEFFKFSETNSEYMELINGEIVYQASPSTIHQRISREITAEIRNYIKSNNVKCEVFSAPFDIKLDEKNVVIPDISVICDPSKIDDKRCNGSPDWIIEITSGNWKDDFIRKLELYRDNNVREYWIVDPKNEKTLVYFFDESDFPNIYTFNTSIPVGIYKNNPIQLEINIAELLKI